MNVEKSMMKKTGKCILIDGAGNRSGLNLLIRSKKVLNCDYVSDGLYLRIKSSLLGLQSSDVTRSNQARLLDFFGKLKFSSFFQKQVYTVCGLWSLSLFVYKNLPILYLCYLNFTFQRFKKKNYFPTNPEASPSREK